MKALITILYFDGTYDERSYRVKNMHHACFMAGVLYDDTPKVHRIVNIVAGNLTTGLSIGTSIFTFQDINGLRSLDGYTKNSDIEILVNRLEDVFEDVSAISPDLMANLAILTPVDEHYSNLISCLLSPQTIIRRVYDVPVAQVQSQSE